MTFGYCLTWPRSGGYHSKQSDRTRSREGTSRPAAGSALWGGESGRASLPTAEHEVGIFEALTALA